MAKENDTTTMMEEEEEEEQNNCLSMYVDRGGSVESHRLYLARRTVLEMLRDRGYGISLVDIDQTLPEFREKYGQSPDIDQLNISSVLLRDPSKKILVVFCGTVPIKKPLLRDISIRYGSENWSQMILVLQSNMTTQSREVMRHLFSFKVETFQVRACKRQFAKALPPLKNKLQITELLINITKHALMPNHERLSSEEKQKLLKEYNIEDTQIPRMMETDAIARYYGYEKGTVLKITYEGELTKTHVTYRCVM